MSALLTPLNELHSPLISLFLPSLANSHIASRNVILLCPHHPRSHAIGTSSHLTPISLIKLTIQLLTPPPSPSWPHTTMVLSNPLTSTEYVSPLRPVREKKTTVNIFFFSFSKFPAIEAKGTTLPRVLSRLHMYLFRSNVNI